MKKRIWSMLLVLLLAISLLPVPAAAAGSGTCGEYLSWTLSDDGVLTIRGTGEMEDYDLSGQTSTAAPWYDSRKSIRSVVIEQGVTSVGSNAFCYCDRLKTAKIPSSVQRIGEKAFQQCTGLESVTIPNGVKTIEAYTFNNCMNLSSIRIPSGVTSIGEFAFSSCIRLTSVTIPQSVKSIGRYAFYGCSGLKSVTIPSGVKRIEDHTFSGCAFESVTIPNGVESIGEEAFSGCSLESVTIPDSVTTIEMEAFRGCSALKRAKIGNGLKILEVWVFWGCIKLKDLTVGTGLQHIRWGAFEECRNLTDIYYPGTEAQWNKIEIDRESQTDLSRVMIHYNSRGPVQFLDVRKGAFYFDAVVWAVEHEPQITKGTSETTFSPDAVCTRGQVVTFLWRAMGCPAPKSSRNPFKDVKSGQYYYDAVLWAAEQGITTGTSATTFSPGDPCTRAHVVTFLWRAEGKPSGGTANPFRDVKKGAYYYDAVLWAVNHEPQITRGMSETSFAPANPCTRGQIVTFLYRDMQ